MNISYPTIKVVDFEDIKSGEVFGYDGLLYMRLKGSYVDNTNVASYLEFGEGDEYNAVCLHDGSLHEFNNLIAVEKVITHVEVVYDRKE